MFSFFKTQIRRITTVFLISIALFVGMAFEFGNTSMAIADAITRDVTNAKQEAPISDAAYEAEKVGRQQKQAERSELANQYNDDKSISEKLNLDEALPRSTKKFVEQITGDEPINNETRP